MNKDELKKIICELIDKSDEKNIDFQQGKYSNIYEEGINFCLEGSFVTKKLNKE